MSFYRKQLEDWLSTLNVKADVVLDIGGAQGEVKDRVKSWDVDNYSVVDLPDWDLNLDWSNDPNKHHVEGADVIFCLEVFEYLYNPLVAMRNIADTLKPGGKAYVTFAFVYPHHNELENDTLRYTEPGIYKFAELSGLIVKQRWFRIDQTGFLERFYDLDGMRKAKQYHNHDATGFIVELYKPKQVQIR